MLWENNLLQFATVTLLRTLNLSPFPCSLCLLERHSKYGCLDSMTNSSDFLNLIENLKVIGRNHQMKGQLPMCSTDINLECDLIR